MNDLRLEKLTSNLSVLARGRDGEITKWATYAEAAMPEIYTLRAQEYKRREINYLENYNKNRHDENEQLDKRSLHVTVKCAGVLRGSLRLTTHPFELSGQIKDPLLILRHLNHMEFSRLIIDSEHKDPLTLQKLLALACICAIAHGAAGIIGLCRPGQARFFRRYGLMAITAKPIIIPERKNGSYSILSGSWEKIAPMASAFAERTQT